MDGKKLLIVTNGDNQIDFLKQIANQYQAIISVDGAANILLQADIMPDYLVGDFDSIKPEVLHRYEQKGTKRVTLIPEKDFTDTHIALDKAVELGYNRIDMAGAFGSRWDHSLGNLNLLYYAFQQGVDLRLIACENEISIIGEGEHNFAKRENYYWSFLALFEDVNISIENMKYNLKDREVKRGESIGLSNEFLGDAKIIIKKGSAIIIQSRMD
ncbi:MAG: thiamine diphosphokinase [Peptostreptococcaceae bacterium]|nr:thiamine diphosphokinase [Peptostreptococcaceae bacterium]